MELFDMCTHKVNIINQSRILTDGMPFKLSVPCGKCFQCQQQKSAEYHLRSYYEAQTCFRKGGFILSTTLTYDDEHLPHLSDFTSRFGDLDFPCFSYPDFRSFMVLLRATLTQDGYDVKDNLRYFVASEYGSKEGYTHRPHLHLLLYSIIPNLKADILSAYVDKCWQNGRTDGITYKPLLYVMDHVYNAAADPHAVNNAIHYVTKYLEKQSAYTSLLFHRFQKIVDKFMLEKGTLRYKEFWKEFIKYSGQFHKQSRFFGIDALKDPDNSLDKVMETGCMTYIGKNGTKKLIPLPQYFARKYFYDLTRTVKGALRWTLNDDGIEFKMRNIDKVIDRFTTHITDMLYNSAAFNNEAVNFCKDILGNRSWRLFAEYVLCFKGRIATDGFDGSYMDSYYLGLSPFFDNVFYNYNTSKDKSLYGCKFVSAFDVHKSQYYYTSKGKLKTEILGNVLQREKFSKYTRNDYVLCRSSDIIEKLPYCFLNDQFSRFVVNDSWNEIWYGFDTIFNVLSSLVFTDTKSEQDAYDKLQELRELYNSLNY